MDLSLDDFRIAPAGPSSLPTRRRLHVSSSAGAANMDAGDSVDVVFNASPAERDRIRVQIQPALLSPDSHGKDEQVSFSPWTASSFDEDRPFAITPNDVAPVSWDPFMGSGASDLDAEFGLGMSSSALPSGGLYTPSKRRVRVTLKDMPAAGREGGEWEVQLC
jgi:hypothetical protein